MALEQKAGAPLLAVTVNGERRHARSTTLATLLEELGYGGQKVATALNGSFVASRMRAETRLSSGDEIEVVAPRQGG